MDHWGQSLPTLALRRPDPMAHLGGHPQDWGQRGRGPGKKLIIGSSGLSGANVAAKPRPWPTSESQ
jgi:hypothetical protein